VVVDLVVSRRGDSDIASQPTEPRFYYY
jgi:hypothetical protein